MLAGCSGGGDSGDGNSGNGDTTATEGGGQGENGENGPDSLIPGEIVHDELDGFEVLDHWTTSKGVVKLRIRNTMESELGIPGSYQKGDPVVLGRTLTSEGNVLEKGDWRGLTVGPSTINAGTTATIGFLINADASQAERYELCLTTSPAGGISVKTWEDLCGDSSETG
jgi:hypothetical protein